MPKFLLIFPTLICSAVLFDGCSHRASASGDGVDFATENIEILRTAVADYDSVTFSAIVSYPLRRPYPLRDIDNADDMQCYFSTLVDDSLRTVITGSRLTDWNEFGWRGWTLADGQYIWVDEAVYDIPYISKKERILYDEMVNREMASLIPSLRNGWVPVGCMVSSDNKWIYRIDSSAVDGTLYRLAVYSGGNITDKTPVAIYTGSLDIEGTADVEIYTFSDNTGTRVIYIPDNPDNSPAELLIQSPIDTLNINVIPAYWLDYVK